MANTPTENRFGSVTSLGKRANGQRRSGAVAGLASAVAFLVLGYRFVILLITLATT